VVVRVYNIVSSNNIYCLLKVEIIMNDPKFVDSELNITPSEELEEEIEAELEEEHEEQSIANLIEEQEDEEEESDEA